MGEKLLNKSDIGKLINELGKEYSIYAATNDKQGNIIFDKIEKAEDILLDYLNSKIPPKSVLFPKVETLFEYEIKDDDIKITNPKDLYEKRIIFGIRPCDAYSFQLFENFFGYGQFKDELFKTKKENTILFGIGCNSPRQTCFCTSVEGHPHKKDDVDVFLVDLGDKYLVESISEKGKNIVQKLSWLSNATKADIQKAKELSKLAEESMSTKIDIKKVIKIFQENFDNPIWDDISMSCIGCGSCTLLCPTCHCFDVIDENDPMSKKGRRIRLWDTCQSTIYTLETSGHNPRPNKVRRFRNRILHKFSYYPTNYDLIGCVGCGRCINICPVNNDLRNIFNSILKIEKKEEVKVV